MASYNVHINGLTKKWEKIEAPTRASALSRTVSRYIPGRYKGIKYNSVGLVVKKVQTSGDYRIIERTKPQKPPEPTKPKEAQGELF